MHTHENVCAISANVCTLLEAFKACAAPACSTLAYANPACATSTSCHPRLCHLHLLSSPLAQVRRGSHPVLESRHTVLLNWNQQALPVLKQVSVGKRLCMILLGGRGRGEVVHV
jgi:hypothetical protein